MAAGLLRKLAQGKLAQVNLRDTPSFRVLFHFVQVGLLYGFSVAGLFFVDVVIGRQFSRGDYGQFAFLRQSIVLVMSLAFLGIDSSLTRLISQETLASFRWRSFFRTVFLILLGTCTLAAVPLALYYNLDTFSTLVLWGASLAGSVSLLGAALLRANSNFSSAQFNAQFWKFFLFFVSLWLLVSNAANFQTFLGFMLLGFILNLGLTGMLLKDIPQGVKNIPLKVVFSEGFLFWANAGILTLTVSVDQFIIAKVLGYESLAQYSASWNIIGSLYLLIFTAIGYVIVPPLIQGSISRTFVARLLLLSVPVGLVLAGVNYWLHAPVIDFVYAGKYAFQPGLTLVFILIGSLRLYYIIPNAAITAWGSARLIGLFALFGVLGVLLNAVLSILLIQSLGLLGAAIGSLAGWLFRFSLSMVLAAKTHPGNHLK